MKLRFKDADLRKLYGKNIRPETIQPQLGEKILKVLIDLRQSQTPIAAATPVRKIPGTENGYRARVDGKNDILLTTDGETALIHTVIRPDAFSAQRLQP